MTFDLENLGKILTKTAFGVWWDFFSWTFCDQGFAQLQIDETMKHYNSRPFTNDMCHLLGICHIDITASEVYIDGFV